jgi:hypothetical protein
MNIQKSSVVVNNIQGLATDTLKVGEKLNAEILKDFGDGFYLIKIKNMSLKVKSFVPLRNVKTFSVVEKGNNSLVLKPDLTGRVFDPDNLISGFPTLKNIESPLIHQIVILFLKKNMPTDEDKILKLYNALKSKEGSLFLKPSLIRFLINLMDEGINVNSELINKLIEYAEFLNSKKKELKNKDFIKHPADNIRQGFFNKIDVSDFKEKVSAILELFKGLKTRDGYYGIMPVFVDDEKFYSEIKIFSEKNALGKKDYGFSANIHLSTGEVRIRGTYINGYSYLRLYFENIDFLHFCKENPVFNDIDAQSIELLEISEIEYDEDVLFSDMYIKDEKLEEY